VKLTIEVDCTPEEARAFLGLPDVAPLNERLVAEMQERLGANLSLLAPDELVKQWAAFGAGAQEQFRKFMSAMVDLGRRQPAGDARPGGTNDG
jgi:hypothetical protein